VINDLRTPFLTKFATSFQIALADHGYSPVLAYTDKNLLQQSQAVPTRLSVRCQIAGLAWKMAETVLEWLKNVRRRPPETTTPVTLIPRA
jgi:hypothetical protein